MKYKYSNANCFISMAQALINFSHGTFSGANLQIARISRVSVALARTNKQTAIVSRELNGIREDYSSMDLNFISALQRLVALLWWDDKNAKCS